MKRSKIVKTLLAAVVIALLAILPFTMVMHARAVQAQAAGAQASAPWENNSNLMGWGVFFVAVGEVGGLLGRGLCSITRERRSQRRQARAATPATELLLYHQRAAAPGGASQAA